MLLSILIPVKDENSNLNKLLSELHVPENTAYEILIADGNVLEKPVAESIELKTNIHVLDNHNGFTPHGINQCLERAKGRYIMLCGAHSYISPNYIETCIRLLAENDDIGCAGGRIVHTGHTPTGKAIAAAMGVPFGMGINSFRSRNKSGFVDTVSVPVFKKEATETVGKFDEQLIRNQDDDYSYRLIKSGYKIYLSEDIWSKYEVRENLAQLSKQFFQYGFWKPYLLRKHRSITTFRQLAPPTLTLLYVCVCIPLYIYTRNIQIILWPLLIYILTVTSISVYLATLKSVNVLFALASLIAMHSSYAGGYITGLAYSLFAKNKYPQFAKTLSRS